MANIKIKDRNGNVRIVNNVSIVKFKDENDNDVAYTTSLFQKTIFMKDENDFYQSQENGQGVATSIPTEPTKAGFLFKGWSAVSHEFIPANKEILPKVYLTSVTLKAMWLEVPLGSALVQGLGSASVGTGGVTFVVDDTFKAVLDDINNGNAEETDTYGNVFNKFPTVYRKVVLVEDSQITYVSLSFTKHDSSWVAYPCFIKPDGVTEMPYILIGKYCFTSTTNASSVSGTAVSTTLNNARLLARALGTGYQLYDWQMQRLFQDLVMVYKLTVNVNANPLLNTYHLDGGVWIDGIARVDTKWLFAYDPADYVDSPTWTNENNHTAGYNLAGYSAPTGSNQTIKKLGYDANHPFFNYPSMLTGESGYNSYYFDGYWYAGGNHPVRSNVGYSDANAGLWFCYTDGAWSTAAPVRLCYRPIA